MRELVVPTQLLVDPPRVLPPLAFNYRGLPLVLRALGLGGPAFLEPGLSVNWCWVVHPHDLQGNCIPIGQIKAHLFTDRLCTHWLVLPLGSGVM